VVEQDEPLELLKIDPSIEIKQKDRLAKLRSERDPAAVQASLARVTAAAQSGGENVMPVIVEAVRTRATLGEVSDAMRETFGEFQAPVFI